jgi:hypothetical protein
MATNAELVRKADLALADLATAGKLNQDQTNRFIRKLIDTPTILQQVRTVAMVASTMKINKIGFGSRILVPASQTGTEPGGDTPAALANTVNARRPTVAQRVKPALTAVTLNSKEVIAEVRIPYEVLEDNIERGRVDTALQEGAGGMHQTIVDLLAERAALDLEELAVTGDTGSGDAYLALTDGYLKLVTSNVTAVGGLITKDAVKAGVKAMPSRFLRNRAAMTHFFSVNSETELRDNYANRQTALGDQHVQGNLPLYVFGSQVKGAAMMPQANGLFTDPQNLIFGIQRNVMLEYDKDIRAREFVIVLTARVAVAIEEEPAVVKYTTIS